MASLSAESSASNVSFESALHADSSSSDETSFMQPAAGRIVAGAGIAGGHLPQVLRHHSSVARRIVKGRMILNIVGRSAGPH